MIITNDDFKKLTIEYIINNIYVIVQEDKIFNEKQKVFINEKELKAISEYKK